MLFPIVALTFLATFGVFLAVFLYLAQRQASGRTVLKRRLQTMAGERPGEIPEELRSVISREAERAAELLTRAPQMRTLGKRLEQAGIRLPASLVLGSILALALGAALLLGAKTQSPLVGLLAAVVVLLVAELMLRVKTERRTTKFTEQFPDALSIAARSLRAGHSFPTAIQLVGQEAPSPVGPLFKTAYEQQQLGLRMVDALMRMNERIDSLDLRFFTTLVAINSDIGGNLSELLDKLAMTIRERLKIRRQVQVYTAQGRLSGYVLAALPVVTFGIFSVLHPNYERALINEPLGVYVLIGAAAMQVVGFLVIRKIVRIRI
ncbi:pilus biosynthesis protein [Geoanaerobacter pelophilus]|uniref:Pilus biosynthesis protein n=1 Tax=Geoanaerobacter pelophilus TaxID=60036 RepID=A0ABQ0MDR2_9BACT|nr:type II secretion system F family protein [Geoanaerobacter pelophilus]GAW65261.1 pilus biosynthesis protein [Geoanaerobacter pelophilus]